MVDETKKEKPDPTPDAPENPQNAATEYGLEEHEATSWDPRVHELKNQRSMNRRTSSPAKVYGTPKAVSTDPSTSKLNQIQQGPTPPKATVDNTQQVSNPQTPATEVVFAEPAKVPDEVSRVELAQETPQKVFVYNPPPAMVEKKIFKEKTLGVTKTTNTDVTFNPSKEYASKTTNTSGFDCVCPPGAAVVPAAEPAPVAEPTPVPSKAGGEMDDIFEFAVYLVRKSGATALSYNKQRTASNQKDNECVQSMQTAIEIEQAMIKEISEKHPTHMIIAAEAVNKLPTKKVTLTNDITWIINAIDGIMNYAHNFPYYCITAAVMVNKETNFGVVFNPPLNALYTARHGEGARLNNEPIRSSGQQEIQQALMLEEYSSGTNDIRSTSAIENAKRLFNKSQGLRSIGSSGMAMAMVASGFADVFYFFGLHVWDMVAGNILITEAGGTVIDPAGGIVDIMSRRVLTAATRPLALLVAAELVQEYPLPRDDETPAAQPKTKDFSAQTEFSDSSDELDSEGSKATAFHSAK